MQRYSFGFVSTSAESENTKGRTKREFNVLPDIFGNFFHINLILKQFSWTLWLLSFNTHRGFVPKILLNKFNRAITFNVIHCIWKTDWDHSTYRILNTSKIFENEWKMRKMLKIRNHFDWINCISFWWFMEFKLWLQRLSLKLSFIVIASDAIIMMEVLNLKWTVQIISLKMCFISVYFVRYL